MAQEVLSSLAGNLRDPELPLRTSPFLVMPSGVFSPLKPVLRSNVLPLVPSLGTWGTRNLLLCSQGCSTILLTSQPLPAFHCLGTLTSPCPTHLRVSIFFENLGPKVLILWNRGLDCWRFLPKVIHPVSCHTMETNAWASAHQLSCIVSSLISADLALRYFLQSLPLI